MIKVAVIDIGSNAIRFQVSNILNYNGQIEFKKLEYIRFPLRLGHDVFTSGRITEESKEKFMKLLQSFKLLTELYEVSIIKASATSAMREAENGPQIAKLVEQTYEFPVEIIDGDKEALLINMAISQFIDDSPHLHIDVGGGSTELTLVNRKQRIVSESFVLGSVRSLKQQRSKEVWENMKSWLRSNIYHKYHGLKGVGTGGNINKLYNLAGNKFQKKISAESIQNTIDDIARYSEEERVNILKLNPDRADVIIPAGEIYLSVMKDAGIKSLLVPEVGLKDGLILSAYEELVREKLLP